MIKHILQIRFALELQWILHLAFSPVQLDFESAPFSHLGTSPYLRALLYQPQVEKSRIFPLLFCQFLHISHLAHDPVIAFPAMGAQTF